MQNQFRREHHEKLVLRMADRQGIDLDERVLRAEFGEDQLEEAIDRCVGCTQPTACAGLLDTSDKAMDLPEFCRNAAVFDRLKPA